MGEIAGWAATGAGLVMTAAASMNVGRLLRTYLRQRALVLLERERSARSAARTAGLVRLADYGPVRLLEQDSDGRRFIEVGRPAVDRREAA